MGWRYANDEERHVANLERRRANYAVNREKRIESTAKSRAKRLQLDPDLNKKDYRQRLEKNPRHNQYAQLLKYGMTIEDYDRLFQAQGGVCAICEQPETTYLHGKLKNLAVDHDKRFTKSHRYLLCSNCNRALGLFRESPAILENAIAYLEYWRVING